MFPLIGCSAVANNDHLFKTPVQRHGSEPESGSERYLPWHEEEPGRSFGLGSYCPELDE